MILLSHNFIYSSLISTTVLFYTFFKISSMRRDKMVLSKYKWVNGINDKQIFLRFWDDVDHPIGVVQIIHGMAEHSRTEEHTSELQSRFELVCRLLPEKKKPTSNSKNRIEKANDSLRIN